MLTKADINIDFACQTSACSFIAAADAQGAAFLRTVEHGLRTREYVLGTIEYVPRTRSTGANSERTLVAREINGTYLSYVLT